MTQKTGSFVKGHKAVPPFIFLSDLLHDYGSCKLQVDETAVDPQINGEASEQVAVSLGWYLADKIEKTEVLLFDVHSLTLISGLELEEVLEYLRLLGRNNPTDIGIEHGRDYYLDGERAMQAIRQVAVTASPRRPRKRKLSATHAKTLTSVGEAASRAEEQVDGWGFKTEYFSVEAMHLKLAESRLVARRAKEYPSPLAARAATKRKVIALPTPATSASHNFPGQGTYFYSVKNFNRVGLPALAMDAAAFTTSGRNIERNAKWQSLLKKMHLIDREKSHKELCEELAKRLNLERGRGEREVTSETIRRITANPGKRGVGGWRPRKLSLKKTSKKS